MEIGIIRKADKMGRIVIPKELREFYCMGMDEPLEIVATAAGILIRKPAYRVTRIEMGT